MVTLLVACQALENPSRSTNKYFAQALAPCRGPKPALRLPPFGLRAAFPAPCCASCLLAPGASASIRGPPFLTAVLLLLLLLPLLCCCCCGCCCCCCCYCYYYCYCYCYYYCYYYCCLER